MHIISLEQEDNKGIMCVLSKYKDFYKSRVWGGEWFETILSSNW